jgi:NADH:ubiquinone oxidoreductase subunit E
MSQTCACAEIASAVAEIVSRYPSGRGSLIPILQDIQDRLGYISPQSLDELQRLTGISASEAYGVATFYTQFRFKPAGRHKIQVCNGTACHVRESRRLTEEMARQLGVDVGETTADGNFSLERVACLGCCALSPVVAVDGKVHANMTPKKVASLLREYGGNGGGAAS